MDVTDSRKRAPWLLLVFSLPSNRASERVEIWRKLQRYGAYGLRSSGYLLPNTAATQEKLEWLATSIRSYKGQASVAQVHAFDDLSDKQLQELFLKARVRDYESLLREWKRILSTKRDPRQAGRMSQLRRKFNETIEIDFFDSPLREKVEALMARADQVRATQVLRKGKAAQYAKRIWMTRPRPGIDRVSSAWLIRRFIDPKARFVFGADTQEHADAIPFDMFSGEGFGHRDGNCSFETLQREFAIRDSKVKRIAQIVHDTDLDDEKFGRSEGRGLDLVLNGWAKQDISDAELLRRGMELIEGLYDALP